MKRRRHTPEQIVRKLREVEPVAGDISIYGQESNYTTWRMARMNLAIRGIEGQIEHGDSFHNDRHPALTGGHAEADQQVRLAGPAVAEQHDGLPPFDPLAAFERCDQRRVDGRRRRQVEVGEVLEPGEGRLVDAALAAARLTVVELGLEQFGEVGEVGEAVAQRGLGEGAGLLAHGREAQRAAGRLDRQRGRLLGHGRAHRGRSSGRRRSSPSSNQHKRVRFSWAVDLDATEVE